MGSSGSHVTLGAWLLVGVLMLATTACGGDDDDQPAPAPGARPLMAERSAMPIDVPLGEPIDASQAAFFVPLLHEGRQVQPAGMYGERVLLAESELDPADSGEPQRFVLFDPASGERDLLWESEPGRQDIVTAVEGDLAVVVRTGLELPFPEWSLRIHNLARGEELVIAEADPAIASAEGLQPTAPFGFAPYPDLQDGQLAWVEFVLRDGKPHREVRLHDLSSGTTSTLATAEPAAGEDLASATLGGKAAAWIRWDGSGNSRVEMLDLETQVGSSVELNSEPYAIALSDDGTLLAWDDAAGGRHVHDLASNASRRFGGSEGWSVTAGGSRLSWVAASAYEGGAAGFYEMATDQLRLVRTDEGVRVNFSALLGGWFTWQELRSGEGNPIDLTSSGYYFLPPGS